MENRVRVLRSRLRRVNQLGELETNMTQDYSRQAVLKFLDHLADKGLANRATVVSRKAAVNTLLSILSDDEASDLRKLDVDDLLLRFFNLKGEGFKPASLNVYKSRLNSVLSDFERYRQNPLGFKSRVTARDKVGRAKADARDADDNKLAPAKSKRPAQPEKVEEQVAFEKIDFPIPIRPGVIVKVTGIPSDLTPDEAVKIGNVILALSGSQEAED
jgi:hypothetical protein